MIFDYVLKAKHILTDLVDFLADLIRSAELSTLLLVAMVVILVSVVMFKRSLIIVLRPASN